ncbi:MAG: FtsW/RodA/SpoVE family cell cycle protein [Lachnospirales bacterium]
MVRKKINNLDYILIISVFALIIFGIIIIGSAKRININGPEGEFINQMIWFATGIVLMTIAIFIDYEFIGKFYVAIYLLNIALLIAVLIFGGNDETGVKRWLFGIQPSEFSKIFMIIYLSKFIDKFQKKINNISVLFFICLTTLIPIVLIKIQPSLSASLVLGAILITELFIGNINSKYIKITIIAVIAIIALVYIDLLYNNHRILDLFLEPYHIKRLSSSINSDFSNPDYYQTKNSIWAIGSGQLRGKGLYNGTINQLSYLPYSHNDFIFSVVGEEFGFLGCLAVLVLMFIIIFRCIKISRQASDNLGMLIAGGVAGMLTFQTFVNVGVATGLLPNTGMPFPFLSYGGSSMWINMIAIGLVLNVGVKKNKIIFYG